METVARGYARIDLDAVTFNLNSIHEKVGTGTRIMAVIKTNAYGHGAVEIARHTQDLDYLYGYCVATSEEAFELRDHGITKEILILGYPFPYSYERLVREDISPVVFREDEARLLSEEALRQHKTLKVYIKVDTGMSRIGIRPDESGIRFIRYLQSLPGLFAEGILTHFANADEEDLTKAYHQLEVYKAFLQKVTEQCKPIPIKECSNSAAIINMPEAKMDMVRAGIILYGMQPSAEVPTDRLPLKEVLSLHSHISFIKEVEAETPVSYGGTYITKTKEKLATIPLGYGDGYPRSLSNKGKVLIRGVYAPIRGRICMDQFMVDVTHIPDVQEGDEVILIGEGLSAMEVGELSGRFNYELTCLLTDRVPRVFVKEGKPCGIDVK
ncbi:MAG: alanine racemase [Lachnospiraceae bacterium]|nr:alanine racemase [Lachnospiraceae bacterium]